MKSARSCRAIPLLLLFGLLLLSAQAQVKTDFIVDGNTAFALDLYAQLKGGNGNLFFSPYSISACLAMTYGGARGNTEMQMAHTLHFDGDQAKFHTAFAENEKQLIIIQQNRGVQLAEVWPQINIANGLWAQKNYPFLAPFLDIATKNYEAKLEQVDFSTDAETARREINDWVSDRTKGKIKDLIGPRVLNALTRLVLVNAIYFKGTWAEQFKKFRTTDQPFFVTPEEKVQTKMMNGSGDYKYAETESLQLLELPYMGNYISMVVVLPKEKNGLVALENSLNQKQLGDWLAQGSHRKVNVFLPKFKMTQEFGLARTLEAIGMKDAFLDSADFSGMDGKRDLFITAVVHKAFVEVNEEGTEAAAATAVMAGAREVQRPGPMPIFRADHPFLFLIRGAESGSILFMGRLTDPTK